MARGEGRMSGIRRTARREPVYGEQGLRLPTLSRVQGASYRYWRMDAFASTALNSDSFDLTEIRFWDAGTLVSSGITATSNLSYTSGSAAGTVDGITNDSNRVLVQSWAAARNTARLDFDFGQSRQITHIEIRSLYAQPRFPASFNLSGSTTDGSNYGRVATVTVGTSFSSIGTNVWSSGQVAVV